MTEDYEPRLLKDMRRKELFVATILNSRQWRKEKYQELTNDGFESLEERDNLGAAHGLKHFAIWVSALPDDDPDLAFLDKMDIHEDGEMIHLHEAALRTLSRFWLNRGARLSLAEPSEKQMRRLLWRIRGQETQRIGEERRQIGTPNGTSGPPYSDDPKNTGSKPETDPK